MTTTPYERIFITVRFSCGCEGIISRFRTPGTESQSRYQSDDYHLCKNCQIKSDQTKAYWTNKPQEIFSDHYMIDGHKWHIYQNKSGYWQGRRYDGKKGITRYFGKVDPRPSLGEPLLEVEVE